YGLLERQFRNYVEKSERAQGPTGENLIVMLERRLANAVGRAGFASSRSQARQNAMVVEARSGAQSQHAVPCLEIDPDAFKPKGGAWTRPENLTTPPITE